MSLLTFLQAERAKYGTIMSDDECVNLLNSVAFKNQPDWGLSGKSFGVHGTRYDGTKCSHDCLHNRRTNHIYDVLRGAGAESTPVWRDLGENTQSSRPWVAPIEPREPAAPVRLTTKIGASLFSLVDLFQREPTRAVDTIAWYRDVLGARVLRVMWRKGTGAPGDYWNNEPHYSLVRTNLAQLPVSLMRETMAFAREEGMTLAHCIFADTLGMTLADQDRFRDGFTEAALAERAATEYIEAHNEPYLDGGGHGGRLPDLQHHVRHLRRAFGPMTLIALGSPMVHMGMSSNSLEAQVRDMHEPCPEANLVTVHFDRAVNRPPDLGPWAPKRRSNGEPRGPGSSVAETDDPRVIIEDLEATNLGGYEWYIYHSEPGIRPRSRNVWDVPNASAIAAAIKAWSRTGSSTGGGGEMGEPYPDEDGWWKTEFKPAVLDRYARAGKELDDMYPVWFARTAYDIRGGMTKQASMEKHLLELDEALGL